ncbi:MAG: 5'/3'-nucleotidase SurE [Proteobacteria bacterium]|nr:5'/3'-nucleotidase SurE [Pseudomonadota bacterium]
MGNKSRNKQKPLIYLTNDDGVQSPGLHALVSEIARFADIKVIAPSHQMTATGRGLFGGRDVQLESTELTVNGESITAYHAPCSPAQVVMLGVKIFRQEREPDLLISGINYGENLGRDITMSGTIGAAIQGTCMGIPSLAVSMQTPIDGHYQYGDVNWQTASYFAVKFAGIMLERAMPPDVDLLKVDVPDSATKKTEWQVTRVARQSYFSAELEAPTLESSLADSQIIKIKDPSHLEKDSDIYVFLKEGKVTVTPISLDFSSRTDLNKLQDYLNNSEK